MSRSLSQRLREMLRRGDLQEETGVVVVGPYSETTAMRRTVAPSDHLCGITEVGRRRQRNEDAFHVSEDGKLLVIADGMGGHQAGDVASVLAIEEIVKHLASERVTAIESGVESFEATLSRALEAAHQKVLQASRDSEREMGAAVGLAYVQGDRLFTCHVGDVRCYLWTTDGFEQITRDHSVVGALVRDGQLTSEEARRHPKKNEILQAVGMSCGIEPEVNSRTLTNGTRVLLCTDGLWEALSDDEIRTIMNSDGTMRQLATLLVNQANRAGGNDNITVILYEQSH